MNTRKKLKQQYRYPIKNKTPKMVIINMNNKEDKTTEMKNVKIRKTATWKKLREIQCK